MSTLEQLVQQIDPQSRLLRSWSLIGGISAQMTALEMVLPDGQTKKLVLRRPGAATLKRNPNAAADEFRLLQIMQSAGLPVPTPYHLDQSDTPGLVIEYIEGQSEYAPAHLPDFVSQAATNLAKIHSIDPSQPGSIVGHAKTFAEKVKSRLAELGTSPEDEKLHKVLGSVGPLPQSNKSVLLHGDYWPGNLLWRDGQLVAVVDWEDAGLGDPLSDLSISRLDSLMLFGVDAMNAFTQHYIAQTAIDLTQLPYWDLLTAARAAPNTDEWTAGYPALGRPDITEQTMRESLRLFIAQALANLPSAR